VTWNPEGAAEPLIVDAADVFRTALG